MSVNGVEAVLYDPTGITQLAVLDQARNITWLDELSKPGNASFELPVDDASTRLVRDRCIVKFRWLDGVRFGCVISSEAATVTNDAGRMWVRYESQPGVGSILGRAVVLPEYGLTRKSGDDRLFGFMSKTGGGATSWYIAEDWATPESYEWRSDLTAHFGYPPVFETIDPYARWIAPAPGPAVKMPAGTVAYYRDTFTLYSPVPVSFYVAADNFVTLYLDGEVVIEPDYTAAQGWSTAQTVKVTLDVGTHIVAARVESATGGGPTAFIMSTVFLSDTGQPGESTQTETVEGDVVFAVDSDDLTPGAAAILDDIISRMTGDAPRVYVVGHADSTGAADYNLALSRRRADTVADYILDAKPGADITASGRGETEPIASNETAAGRARNRRVDITYTAATEPTTTPGDTQTVTVVRRSDLRWKVHAGTPPLGWFRASVLRQLFLEARSRYVAGFLDLEIDYDHELDSSGRAWEIRGEYSFPIATLSVLEIAMQLAEAEMDWALDPDTMTLRAWVRRGEDRSVGNEPVTLWAGGNLLDCETTRTSARVTLLITHLADGAWLQVTDAPGLNKVGRVEVGMSLGSALAPATARNVAKSMLAESAAPAITVTGATSSLRGPLPYQDYGVGDTLSVPGHKGVGRMRARVISISVDASSDTVKAHPELVLDQSASIGLDGPGTNIYVLYAIDGVLTTSLAPPGAQSIKPTFIDDGDVWEMRVGAAQQISLISSAGDGQYSAAVPLIVPTDDPDFLLAVWVDNGTIATEERNA